MASYTSKGLCTLCHSPNHLFSNRPSLSLRRQALHGSQHIIYQSSRSSLGVQICSSARRTVVPASQDDVHVDAKAVSVSPHAISKSFREELPSDESDMEISITQLKEGGWQRRWSIVALCFSAFMLCNMDRVNMSIAILPMSEQFAWDNQVKGLVQSSFFWGYLLTQVLGGIWADRYGGKKVLGLGVLWWSVATALTPIAAQMGLPALLAARACMGIGEGVAMPAMNNLLSRWVPLQERSRSLSFVYSGMFVGSIMGLGLSPHFIDVFKWPSVFYVFGLVGIGWYVGWNQFASPSPKDDVHISSKEREYILANTPSQEPVQKIPWKLLLSKKEVLGLNLLQSGLFSVLPWVSMSICANAGGWIADALVPKIGVTYVRKLMQSIGFLGPAFFLTQLCKADTVPLAVGCMMCSQGLDAFSQSGLYSNHQDIGPRYAGVLLGMSNTAGVLAGVLGTYATGYILAHGSWDQVWGVAVVLYLIGTLIWNLFATGEQVFE